MIIVGLGNPGEEYARTRHNVGRMALRAIAEKLGSPKFESKSSLKALVARTSASLKTGTNGAVEQTEIFLVEPLTYMNESGQAVQGVTNFFKLPTDSLYVLHDDLDIELGSYKIQFGTGPKVHNGLLSVYNALGTDQFWHVRIGVDGRNGDRSMPGQAYVLQPFSMQEQSRVDRAIIDLVAQLLPVVS